MKFHKEGYPTLAFVLLIDLLLIFSVCYLSPQMVWLQAIVYAIAAFLLIVILQFFRSPFIKVDKNPHQILCPADGKVVVIEETQENEYFKDKRIQISVFMSPINVHINRYPIGGIVKYLKYHPGKFLVAWHPKSSTENERTTIVVADANGFEVLIRQIAGALARRIVFYPKENEKVEQGDQLGFIKFGSRVDIFLPIGTKINCNIGDVVTGGKTILASI